MRAAQSRLAQLEAVIDDTEAELARLQGRKVASMVRVYQGERAISRHARAMPLRAGCIYACKSSPVAS